MSRDQWNVLGLIILLVLLEAGRSKNVSGFFHSWYSNFNRALKNSSGGSSG